MKFDRNVSMTHADYVIVDTRDGYTIWRDSDAKLFTDRVVTQEFANRLNQGRKINDWQVFRLTRTDGFYDSPLNQLKTIPDIKRALQHLKLKLSLMEKWGNLNKDDTNGTLSHWASRSRRNSFTAT